MTDKELKKLNRTQLLEMLLAQTKKVEELEEKIKEAESVHQEEKAELLKKIEKREIAIEKAGSIAEAALNVSGIFEAAQQAADQYLENIQELLNKQEASYSEKEAKCDTLFEDTKEYCDKMKEDTKTFCQSLEDDTKKRCEALEEEVKNRCERMEEDTKKRCRDAMRKLKRQLSVTEEE